MKYVVYLGFLIAVVIMRILFFKRIAIDIFPGAPMSLLVNDKYDIGKYRKK